MEAIKSYTFIADLGDLIDAIQTDSIISRTVYKDKHLKAILFGFDTGQELSEHTSSHDAVIHILKGNASITLGEDQFDVEAGAWIHMQAHLKHSVVANTPLQMLLLMFDHESEQEHE